MTLQKYMEGKKLAPMAKKFGCSVPYLSQLVNGRRRCSPEMALQISSATKGKIKPMDLLYAEKN